MLLTIFLAVFAAIIGTILTVGLIYILFAINDIRLWLITGALTLIVISIFTGLWVWPIVLIISIFQNPGFMDFITVIVTFAILAIPVIALNRYIKSCAKNGFLKNMGL
jgi:hypothetical protein